MMSNNPTADETVMGLVISNETPDTISADLFRSSDFPDLALPIIPFPPGRLTSFLTGTEEVLVEKNSSTDIILTHESEIDFDKFKILPLILDGEELKNNR